MSERISASEFARRAGCSVKQVRRALARGALERGADGLLDASMIGQAWRRPNQRTLARAARDAWPLKVAPFVAAEPGVEADAVTMLLGQYIYRPLRELGKPQSDFTES